MIAAKKQSAMVETMAPPRYFFIRLWGAAPLGFSGCSLGYPGCSVVMATVMSGLSIMWIAIRIARRWSFSMPVAIVRMAVWAWMRESRGFWSIQHSDQIPSRDIAVSWQLNAFTRQNPGEIAAIFLWIKIVELNQGLRENIALKLRVRLPTRSWVHAFGLGPVHIVSGFRVGAELAVFSSHLHHPLYKFQLSHRASIYGSFRALGAHCSEAHRRAQRHYSGSLAQSMAKLLHTSLQISI